MINFKTDNEAREWYSRHGLTSKSTSVEIIEVSPLLSEISKDAEHRGWHLKMIDGLPGFDLGTSPR